VGLEDILTRLKAVLLEKLAGSVWASPRLFDAVWMDGLRVRAFSLLEPRAGWRVLDVGCGDGWSTIENALVFYRVFFLGLDLYEAWEAWGNARLFGLTNCGFVCGDVFRIGFRKAFDAIMLYFSLGNMCSGRRDLLALFARVRDFLKSEGKVLVVEPFQEDFKEFEKLSVIYEISGIKGVGEEKETILGFRDVVYALKNTGFDIVEACKYSFSWKISEEEFLEYFRLRELPFKLSEFYFRDKPGKATIIVAYKR